MAPYRRNPFTPTFGTTPFALAGRAELVDDVIYGLSNQPGDPNRSTIFIGPRGSGKTVLLAHIAEEAVQMGWVYASATTREGLLGQLEEQLVTNAAHLLPEEKTSHLTSIQLGPVGLSREIRHAQTTFGGHEECSWRGRVQRLIAELNAQGVGVLFMVDEVDPTNEELISFIIDYQHFVVEHRDVAMLLAGLPSKVLDLLVEEHVSFIRRAFQRKLKRIAETDVREAFLTTIRENGKEIEPEALDMAVKGAQGFAFAIQLIGYSFWRRVGERTLITCEDVEYANERAYQEMEYTIIQPTLHECSRREMEYLQVMAIFDGQVATSDVARAMGISMSNASNLRRRLIDRGVLVDLRYGVVDFDMPIFRTYLREH